MGSTSRDSPNPNWTPYDSFKECAQGLCNMYCPQWCSYPPPDLNPGDDSGTTFSPLIIAVIGILASAFLLVSYYAIITKYCRRRRQRNPNIHHHHDDDEHDHEYDEGGQIWQQVGLDETLINSITVFKYKKGERLVEGTECSVCLNEFQENENLRLLPKCCHAFHPSCIDVWLKSHTNCPLCRANAVPTYTVFPVTPPTPTPPPPPPSSQSSNTAAAAPEIQSSPQHDLILVVQQEQEGAQRSTLHSESRNNSSAGTGPSTGASAGSLLLDEDRQIRRSISLGTFTSHRSSLLVADILKIEEEEEEEYNSGGIGSSSRQENHKSNSTIRRNPELSRASGVGTVKRSFSTGRFYFYKTS